ncbi:unnamed protein product, partial [Iphiclides podalirius]
MMSGARPRGRCIKPPANIKGPFDRADTPTPSRANPRATNTLVYGNNGDQHSTRVKFPKRTSEPTGATALVEHLYTSAIRRWDAGSRRRVRHSTVSLRGVGEASGGPDNEPLEPRRPLSPLTPLGPLKPHVDAESRSERRQFLDDGATCTSPLWSDVYRGCSAPKGGHGGGGGVRATFARTGATKPASPCQDAAGACPIEIYFFANGGGGRPSTGDSGRDAIMAALWREPFKGPDTRFPV